MAAGIQMKGGNRKDELGKTELVQYQRGREGRTEDSEEGVHMELKKSRGSNKQDCYRNIGDNCILFLNP